MSKEGFTISIGHQTTVVSTAEELVVALDVLQGQHDRQVLEQLQSSLPKIIRQFNGLFNILRVLSTDDKIFLVKALGKDLVIIIGSAASLRDLLATIFEMEVEETILTTLGTAGCQKLIESPDELSEVLEWVYGECDIMTLNLLGIDYIKKITRSGFDLSLVLQSLNQQNQQDLIDKLSWSYIVSLIKETRDFAHLMRTLPMIISGKLIDSLPESTYRRIIVNRKDLEYINRFLDEAEVEYLSKKLKEINHAV